MCDAVLRRPRTETEHRTYPWKSPTKADLQSEFRRIVPKLELGCGVERPTCGSYLRKISHLSIAIARSSAAEVYEQSINNLLYTSTAKSVKSTFLLSTISPTWLSEPVLFPAGPEEFTSAVDSALRDYPQHPSRDSFSPSSSIFAYEGVLIARLDPLHVPVSQTSSTSILSCEGVVTARLNPLHASASEALTRNLLSTPTLIRPCD